MAKTKKDSIDLDLTLVRAKFILKGHRQEIEIYTKATEVCDFVDWINNNPAINTHKVEEKGKFNNKYFTLTDYKNKETVTINKDDVKAFRVPFFVDAGEEIEWKIIEVR